jgi:hypothetical protein
MKPAAVILDRHIFHDTLIALHSMAQDSTLPAKYRNLVRTLKRTLEVRAVHIPGETKV